MGIKQSIVVKNRFTMKSADGRGTRGSTPGDYVRRYMGREEATEPVLPVANSGVYDYLTRYAARADAVEAAYDLSDAKQNVERVGRIDGVAFSGDSVSLSGSDFKAVSQALQDVFDDGRPVLECVLSFDTEYLRENNLIDPATQVVFRGDLRGKVDQLKLRSAIQEGMSALSNKFDDLIWVGVLQFDTKHVHAHLALAENDPYGTQRMRSDGQHKGVLSKPDIKLIRRGIDNALDRTKKFPRMSAEVSNQRLNVRSFVRDFAYKELGHAGDMQLIIAALPENERLWRAASNRREMRRANELTTQFVRDVFAQENSGYSRLEASIEKYARHRAHQEGAGPKRERQLRDNGIQRLERECVNVVYAQIAQWQHRPVHTRAIDIMASDIAEAAQLSTESEADEWLFRIRTYGGRLREAQEQRIKYHDLKREWESHEKVGKTDPASKAAYDFYVFEEAYQTRILSKYQSLIPFSFMDADLRDEIREYRDMLKYVDAMEQVIQDSELYDYNDHAIDSIVLTRYGVRHGSDAIRRPEIYARRLNQAHAKLDAMREELQFKLGNEGRGLVVHSNQTVSCPKIELVSFDEARGSDLHHLQYDFSDDIEVAPSVVYGFADLADERKILSDSCLNYFEQTGQMRAFHMMPRDDINAMVRCADEVRKTGLLKSARDATDMRTPIHTVRVGSRSADVARDDVLAMIAEAGIEPHRYVDML